MKKLLPHICMDAAFIFLTLAVIDQINPAMHFLSRNIFKYPLMIFLTLVIIQSFSDILRNRADYRRHKAELRKEKSSKEQTDHTKKTETQTDHTKKTETWKEITI